jgi:hypothetical protein
MQFLVDPAEMAPERRRSEIAAILAEVYHRQRTTPFTEKPMDVSRTPAPPCENGLTDPVEVEA